MLLVYAPSPRAVPLNGKTLPKRTRGRWAIAGSTSSASPVWPTIPCKFDVDDLTPFSGKQSVRGWHCVFWVAAVSSSPRRTRRLKADYCARSRQRFAVPALAGNAAKTPPEGGTYGVPPSGDVFAAFPARAGTTNLSPTGAGRW